MNINVKKLYECKKATRAKKLHEPKESYVNMKILHEHKKLNEHKTATRT